MPPRTFTPRQANEALGEVRPIAERMVEHARLLAEAEASRAIALTRIAGNGGDMPPSELGDLVAAVEREASAIGRCIERMTALGVQVKDAETGLVDFPALRGEEPVLLCWQVGEEEVGFWHGLDDGFAGRRPLPL